MKAGKTGGAGMIKKEKSEKCTHSGSSGMNKTTEKYSREEESVLWGCTQTQPSGCEETLSPGRHH